jgi:hypothetical protein
MMRMIVMRNLKETSKKNSLNLKITMPNWRKSNKLRRSKPNHSLPNNQFSENLLQKISLKLNEELKECFLLQHSLLLIC